MTSPIPLELAVYQDTLWCNECGGPRLFLPICETDFGRVFVCMGCEAQKFVAFTRVTQEAA